MQIAEPKKRCNRPKNSECHTSTERLCRWGKGDEQVALSLDKHTYTLSHMAGGDQQIRNMLEEVQMTLNEILHEISVENMSDTVRNTGT